MNAQGRRLCQCNCSSSFERKSIKANRVYVVKLGWGWQLEHYIALNIFFAIAKICSKNARACTIEDIIEGVVYTCCCWGSTSLLPKSRIISTSNSTRSLHQSHPIKQHLLLHLLLHHKLPIIKKQTLSVTLLFSLMLGSTATLLVPLTPTSSSHSSFLPHTIASHHQDHDKKKTRRSRMHKARLRARHFFPFPHLREKDQAARTWGGICCHAIAFEKIWAEAIQVVLYPYKLIRIAASVFFWFLFLCLLLKKKGSIKARARVCNWRSCNPKFLLYFYHLSCCSRQSKKGDCKRLFFCFWVWWWSTLSTGESSCFGFWLLSTARQTFFFPSSKQQQKGYADLNKSLQLMRLFLNLCNIIAG